ncbi:VanZ family protein [Bacillus shivajii]|uniref:VanZ family protein n=1 Tax=Bacillus shivajii TaxID=1983719 RepID=UPI001CF97D90|nr:VanZ family protein [Bacillus shivajii]UCZ54307.1 VanZ family protein [Bacillus shivajii]
MFNSIITFGGAYAVILFIIIDFIRYRSKNLFKRAILYSFLFYLLFVADRTIGYLFFPPFEDTYLSFQLIPFYFVRDILFFEVGSWYFWNTIKLSFYNLIMLAPLGVYLSLLFDVRSMKKAVLIIFSVSFFIEVYQLVFTYFGLTLTRTFNVDDLILNTLGGVIAFIIFRKIKQYYHLYFKPTKVQS